MSTMNPKPGQTKMHADPPMPDSSLGVHSQAGGRACATNLGTSEHCTHSGLLLLLLLRWLVLLVLQMVLSVMGMVLVVLLLLNVVLVVLMHVVMQMVCVQVLVVVHLVLLMLLVVMERLHGGGGRELVVVVLVVVDVVVMLMMVMVWHRRLLPRLGLALPLDQIHRGLVLIIPVLPFGGLACGAAGTRSWERQSGGSGAAVRPVPEDCPPKGAGPHSPAPHKECAGGPRRRPGMNWKGEVPPPPPPGRPAYAQPLSP